MAVDATIARTLLERADAARIEYGTALAQIMDDARAAGIAPDSILPDIALSGWARDQARRAQGSIYFAKVDDLDVVKVGFSTSVADRMRALRSEHGRGFDVLGTISGTMADERYFHRLFWWCRDSTLKGTEFFKFSLCRGLVRILIGNADTFPWDENQKREMSDWIWGAHGRALKAHPESREVAFQVMARAFEYRAAQALGETK